jgi:hypothetical protein
MSTIRKAGYGSRMDPIVVEVRRGGVVEARQRIHAVAVESGAVIAEAGDPALVAFMRSSSKPFQVIPAVRARDDLDERDLAIASASHLADDDQLAAVRALLAKAPAHEGELECGLDGHPPSRLKHNCSGKHAGMLALCRGRGWRTEGYRLKGHQVQREMLAIHAEAADVREDELPTAAGPLLGTGEPRHADDVHADDACDVEVDRSPDVGTRAGQAEHYVEESAHTHADRGDRRPLQNAVVKENGDGQKRGDSSRAGPS